MPSCTPWLLEMLGVGLEHSLSGQGKKKGQGCDREQCRDERWGSPGQQQHPSNCPLPPSPQAAAYSDSDSTDGAAHPPQPPFQTTCRLRPTIFCAQTSEMRECTSVQPLILLLDGLFSFNLFFFFFEAALCSPAHSHPFEWRILSQNSFDRHPAAFLLTDLGVVT